MSIYRNLLTRGYLPKELPPSFYSDDFAKYASTRDGREALTEFHQRHPSTECCDYTLALPSTEHRLLRIPHPSGFAHLSREVARSFRRLLKKAGTSRLSRSRPVYSEADQRAIRTLIDPSNLARERALNRAAASVLLRTDVSQFYPSLYTHAIGWSIDPKLRRRENWQNRRFLGKRIDQAMMDIQGKVSQGVPIGNDISFLLAEIVLGQVDKDLQGYSSHAIRWYDDYEIACDTRKDAEAALAQLRSSLAKFNLRLNPRKTSIVDLPIPSSDSWQRTVIESSRGMERSNREMIRFFDAVFDLRLRHPDVAVLLYAIGLLFRISVPSDEVLRVAESCITQSVLCEPGCAQKAFALLTFWGLNGAPISHGTVSSAIERLIRRHEACGTTSDLSWALAYAIGQKTSLSRVAATVLSEVHEDCVTIQSLHAHELGLLPKGFSTRAAIAELRQASPEGCHWLALYEAVRQNFLPSLAQEVQKEPLFAHMLAKGVSFYRQQVPAYATIIQQGGAPQWVVRAWLEAAGVAGASERQTGATRPVPSRGHASDLIRQDAAQVAAASRSVADAVLRLLAKLQPEPSEPEPESEPYS